MRFRGFQNYSTASSDWAAQTSFWWLFWKSRRKTGEVWHFQTNLINAKQSAYLKWQAGHCECSLVYLRWLWYDLRSPLTSFMIKESIIFYWNRQFFWYGTTLFIKQFTLQMTTIQSQIAIPIHMCSHIHRTGQTKDCLLFDLSKTYCSFLIYSLRLSSRKFIAVITNNIIIICLWFKSWWFFCYSWGVIFKMSLSP